LHLWPLENNAGYTPLELFSPMDGIVAELYISLNDTINRGEVLLSLENRNNLTLRAKINRWQAPFIKRNTNVTLFYDSLKIKGAVLDVDKKDHWITVVVPNQQLKLETDLFVNGFVHLKNVVGDYLPANIWGEQDSLLAEIEEGTSLDIFKVGFVGDSLVLISPSLPDINEIQIKKNLDFNK
ncbi:MAG: HlyD family secretion protein, partial [Bacteroidetes bacterium]